MLPAQERNLDALNSELTESLEKAKSSRDANAEDSLPPAARAAMSRAGAGPHGS